VNGVGRIFVFAILAVSAIGCTSGSRSRPLAWDPLSFPNDSDWPGPKGGPAKLAGNALVLQGQDVRTKGLYGAPLTVEYDVELEARATSDGSFEVKFIPSGEPAESEPHQMVKFRMIFRNPGAYSGKDGLAIERRSGSLRGDTVWGEEPFDLRPAVSYHVILEILADRFRMTINKRTYEALGVTVPYKLFYVQLSSWQPQDKWLVRNFAVR
jgi:hypothetical protein